MNTVTVYQGFYVLDDRKYNYWTLSMEEARDYGYYIRKAVVSSDGMLNKRTQYSKYCELLEEFGQDFDILDNTENGLRIQEEFFAFLEGKGYNGFANIGSPDSQYVVTFQ